MKITFDNSVKTSEDYKKNITSKNSAVNQNSTGYRLDNSGGVYQTGSMDICKDYIKKNTGKSKETIMQEATEVNVETQRDFYTVMSNTVSAEDMKKMEENGFSYSEIDADTCVTILDKIKAELIKSGQNITGYTDQIAMDTLTEAVGDEVLAQTLASSFEKNDLPCTEENVDKVLQAIDMAEQLKTPSSAQYSYMVTNEMEPTIRDFYYAQNSGISQSQDARNGYYTQEIKGYLAKTETMSNSVEGMVTEQEAEKLVINNKLEVTAENMQAAHWLIQNGVDVDKSTILKLNDLQKVQFPVPVETVISGAVSALLIGKESIEADLSDTRNIYEKATELVEYYQSQKTETLLTNHIQLEEIRLNMTVEANIKLLKSGFTIDTESITELIDTLKNAKNELASQYFTDNTTTNISFESAKTNEQYDPMGWYQKTQVIVKEIPTFPASLLGNWADGLEEDDLNSLYQSGKTAKDTYIQANEKYETMMTAPRADLGDSIRKAFSNVDNILEDLGYETTEEYRKVIRVLGYNSMQITGENIDKVKKALDTVTEVVEKITPSATLKMIRDGVNPLECSMQELKDYFDNLPEEFQESSEKYSKFLVGLEQNKEITEEEKTAFIGTYRLLRQIEKSDSSAIGNVVNTGAELNFATLLSSVRSGKFKHMDLEISDNYATISELVKSELSISEQIQKGYAKTWEKMLEEVSESQEGMDSYYNSQIKTMKEAYSTNTEIYHMLEKADIPITTYNLLAADSLTNETGALFQKLKERKQTENSSKANAGKNIEANIAKSEMTEMSHAWESSSTKEEFETSYTNAIKEERLELENGYMEENLSSIDVKELQLMHKQLTVMNQLSEQDQYFFSIDINGQTTGIHLTFAENQEMISNVQIKTSSALTGTIYGEFSIEDNRVNGAIWGNSKDDIMNSTEFVDIFNSELANGLTIGDIEFVEENAKSRFNNARNVNEATANETTGSKDIGNKEKLYQVAKVFLNAVSKY